MPIAAAKVRLTLKRPSWFNCAFAWVEFSKGIEACRVVVPSDPEWAPVDGEFGTDEFPQVAYRITEDALNVVHDREGCCKLILGHVYNGEAIKDIRAKHAIEWAISEEINKYSWLK